MMKTARERVARGASWLDREFPDWAHLINTDRLDIANHRWCVGAQLYGSWYYFRDLSPASQLGGRGRRDLGFNIGEWSFINPFAVKYRQLTQAWREQIAQRVNPDDDHYWKTPTPDVTETNWRLNGTH